MKWEQSGARLPTRKSYQAAVCRGGDCALSPVRQAQGVSREAVTVAWGLVWRDFTQLVSAFSEVEGVTVVIRNESGEAVKEWRSPTQPRLPFGVDPRLVYAKAEEAS